MKVFSIACAIALFATSATANNAGLQIKSIALPHHEKNTSLAIWYPSLPSSAPSFYAETSIFEGVKAHIDAPIADGRHPVVLFSHGLGGTDRAQAWLGAGLAERGALAVFVNHPNSTWGDFDMSKGVHHWTRVIDMRTALDFLHTTTDFSHHMDASRIMAAGFSYGGWTALSMGGVTGDHAGLVDACQRFGERMEACDLLLSDKVNLPTRDPVLWNADYKDSRITHVVAIDPAFVWGLNEANVTSLVPNTLLIGFGGGEDRMLATDFDRSGFSKLLADRHIERFDPAYHFTAMPICKPAGEAILKEEKDDPVCTDPVGSDRAAIHDALIAMISQELGL